MWLAVGGSHNKHPTIPNCDPPGRSRPFPKVDSGLEGWTRGGEKRTWLLLLREKVEQTGQSEGAANGEPSWEWIEGDAQAEVSKSEKYRRYLEIK